MKLTWRRAAVVVTWSVAYGFLTWLTIACLFGHARYVLSPGLIRGQQAVGYVVLPVRHRVWPGDFKADVLENGRSLSALHKRPRTAVRAGAPSAPRFTVLWFPSSDGSNPATNGRRYVVVYPRRQLPSTLVLLVLSWVLVPAAARRTVRCLEDPREGERCLPGPREASLVAAGLLFSVFAAQAWLPAPSAPWLLGLVAVCIPSLLIGWRSVLGPLPEWLVWAAALPIWAAISVRLGTSSYGSPRTLERLVLACCVGVVLYYGLRDDGSPRRWGAATPMLTVFVVGVGMSLARDAGFDLVGPLASLGLSARYTGKIVNPWTTKFVAQWLVVVTWCALAAVGWRRRDSPRRPERTVLMVAGTGLVAIVVASSQTALLALVASGAVALLALRWPRRVRRLVVIGIAVGVLSAPLLAAVPWRIDSILPTSVAKGVGGALELDVRGGTWEFTRRLIAERPLVGWGVGASASLPGQGLSMATALGVDPSRASDTLKTRAILAGGHPHNAALLVWLDLGLIGALLVAGLVFASGRAISRAESFPVTHASLLGLLTATAFVLVFNYPLWEPEILAILWMSVAMASSSVPVDLAGGAERAPGWRIWRTWRPWRTWQTGVAVLLVLALGSGLLYSRGAARRSVLRDLGGADLVLNRASRTITGAGRTWNVSYDGSLDAGAGLVHGAAPAAAAVRGWAFRRSDGSGTGPVLVFVGARLAGVVWPERPSPEVFERAGDTGVAALTSGFSIPVRADRLDLSAPVTVVAWDGGRPAAVELAPLSSAGPATGPPASAPGTGDPK